MSHQQQQQQTTFTFGLHGSEKGQEVSSDYDAAQGRSISNPMAAPTAAPVPVSIVNYNAQGLMGSSEPMKRKRGRPKKNRTSEAGVKLTPHVIFAQAGECLSTKIMALSLAANSNVCILAANGTISRVTLRHSSSGSMTYEGPFQILTLGGSLLICDNSGLSHSHRYGGLNVSLFGRNGHVVEGGVTGDLIAASTTQVILLSFPGHYYSESKLKNQTGSSSAQSKGLGGQK